MSFSSAAPDSLPPAVSPLDGLLAFAGGAADRAEQNRWFREEVHPHESAVRAYLHRKFPDLRDLDDIVQESYSRLISARQSGVAFEPRAYFFTIARNAAYDHFRRQRTVSLEALEESAAGPVVEDNADAAALASHAQEIALLAEAIQSLPPRCREVLTLRRLHGLSYREIARRLGITEYTVNGQLAIGMIRCRQYLEARGVLPGGSDVP